MRETRNAWIRTICVVFFMMMLFLLPGCAGSSSVVRVGVVDGPEAVIMEFVKEKARQENLTVEIVVCKDYAEPNRLLAKGKIDANSFQPQFFLEQQQREHGYPFAVLGRTVFFPLGLYAPGVMSLEDLSLPIQVWIPQDIENRQRAMQLLAKTGYPLYPAEQASEAPPAILWQAMPAEKMNGRKTPEQAFVMQPVFADEAGCAGKALLLENISPAYSHVLAVRQADTERDALKKLLSVYQSEDVRYFIREHFAGSVLPAW